MMWSVSSAPGDVRSVLGVAIDDLLLMVGSLSDAELIRPTGCEGWRVADLVVHLRMGAEALLAGLVCPSEKPSDRDLVSYWRDWPVADRPGFSDVRTTWAMAAAYGHGESLIAHFADVVTAAARAAREAPSGRFAFQGHVLEAEDLLGTWVVEFTLHHLDLLVGLPDRPEPSSGALEFTAWTLDQFIGAPRPGWWDIPTYVRKATGRLPLSDTDRSRLGATEERYPAFG